MPGTKVSGSAAYLDLFMIYPLVLMAGHRPAIYAWITEKIVAALQREHWNYVSYPVTVLGGILRSRISVVMVWPDHLTTSSSASRILGLRCSPASYPSEIISCRISPNVSFPGKVVDIQWQQSLRYTWHIRLFRRTRTVSSRHAEVDPVR